MKHWPATIDARKCRRLRVARTVILTSALFAFGSFCQLSVAKAHLDQQNGPTQQSRTVPRLRIGIGKTVEFPCEESILAAILSDPEIASATLQGDRALLLSGLRVGHTVLIVSGRTRQFTYALDVVKSRSSSKDTASNHVQNGAQPPFSGSQGFHYTLGNQAAPSSLRYTFDFRQQLQNKQTLRAAGELFRFFGDQQRLLNAPLADVFGANRLMFGVDSRTTKIDFFDSQLRTSSIGFNGYTLRGLHFISTPESRWRGVEFFAGNARPQIAIFSRGEGRLAGMNVPIWRSETFAIRAGAVWIAPGSRALSRHADSEQNPKSAFVWQTGFHYSLDENTNMSGDVTYSKRRVSWVARIDSQRGPFRFSAESLHLSPNSPLIRIGAQADGRTSSALNFQWTPAARFDVGTSFTRTIATPAEGSTRATLNTRLLLVRTNVRPVRNTHLNFTFKDQFISLPASLSAVPLNLEISSVGVKWNQRLGRNWANTLEAQATINRENNTDLRTNRGLLFREQLRYRWRNGSVDAFVNVRNRTPSLEGLILRNPALLPADFRAAFAADPRGFLLTNRRELPIILNGIELPVTRETMSGLNFQTSFGRASFMGETVYSSGIFAAARHNSFQVSVSGNVRLDASNTLQLRVSRLFASSGTAGQTVLTIGYIHRFGSDAGSGFQLFKLFRTNRARIQGRVFMDFNNNNQQDEDETGIGGMTVQLDASRTVTTDARGNFRFESLQAGEYELSLISSALGVTLRANSMLHRISVSPRQTVTLSLGLSSTGSLAGRAFNDLLIKGQHHVEGDEPGVKAVLLRLYKVDADSSATKEQRSLYQNTNSNGDYHFRNLAPGRYVLEVDPNTVPANFQVPSKTSWEFVLGPLQNLYFDLPFVAQRAISGIVYIDIDGDEKFDQRKDRVVAGARIVAGASEAVSNPEGLYLLRDLRAGPLKLEVYSPAGKAWGGICVELGPEPALRTGVNLRITTELSR